MGGGTLSSSSCITALIAAGLPEAIDSVWLCVSGLFSGSGAWLETQSLLLEGSESPGAGPGICVSMERSEPINLAYLFWKLLLP